MEKSANIGLTKLNFNVDSAGNSFSFNQKGTMYFAKPEMLMSFFKSLPNDQKSKFITNALGKRYLVIYIHNVALEEFNEPYIQQNRGDILFTYIADIYCLDDDKWRDDEGFIDPSFYEDENGDEIEILPWQLKE